MAALLCGLALLFALFPQVLAWPLAAIAAWTGLALLYRSFRLRGSHAPRSAIREGGEGREENS